jgi:hypothetical protein
VQVRHRENDNVCIIDSVENTKWKSPRYGTPSIPIDHLVLQGILYDPIKHGVHLSNKLAPQVRPFAARTIAWLAASHPWPVVLLEGDTSQLP